jgi:hypothetical protein
MAEKEKEEQEKENQSTEKEQEGQPKEALDVDIKLTAFVQEVIATQTDKAFKQLVRDAAIAIGKSLGCTITVQWPGEQRRDAYPITHIEYPGEESLDHPDEDRMNKTMDEVYEIASKTHEELHPIEFNQDGQVFYLVCKRCGWVGEKSRNAVEAYFYGVCHSLGQHLRLGKILAKDRSSKRVQKVLDRTREALIG